MGKMKELYMEKEERELFERITKLSKKIFHDNNQKGFWDDCWTQTNVVVNGEWTWEDTFTPSKANTGEKLMLMVSELAEAMEADRKDLMDDHLPKYKGLHVELADCLIRILDYCGAYNIPIGTIMEEKLEYNRKRPHKHGKEY